MSLCQKIFISNINSSLSGHIIQQLRNDHEDLQNHNIFVGTSVLPLPSSAITQIYDLEKQKVEFCSALLECTIFVMNLENINEEIYIGIRGIQSRGKHGLSTKVIGVSSFATWTASKPLLKNLQKVQKEETLKILKESIRFEQGNQKIFKESDYLQRKPCFLHKYQFAAEEHLLKLRQYQSVETSILCRGLLYGMDFPEKQLQQMITAAYQKQNMKCYGLGLNYLPLTHVQQVLDALTTVLTIKKPDPFYIIVNSEPEKQIQVLEALMETSGNYRPIKYLQLDNISEQQIVMNENIIMKKSQLFNQDSFSHTSFKKYIETNIQEVADNLQICPLHLLIDYRVIEMNPECLQTLKQSYKIIEINDDLFEDDEYNEPRDVTEMASMVVQRYLEPLKYSHYIIANTNNISMSEQTLQQHKILRVVFEESEQSCLVYNSEEYWRILNMDNPTNENNQKSDKDTENKEDQKQERLSLNEERAEIDDVVEQQQAASIKQDSSFEDEIIEERIQNKTSKIDQYLNDNVVSFLGEALMRTKNRNSLEDLIKELKKIYQREIQGIVDD